MGKDLSFEEQGTLERLIDECGLCAVLQGLSDICTDKADHIRYSYQDNGLAKAWDTAGGHIGVLSTHKDIMRVGEP